MHDPANERSEEGGWAEQPPVGEETFALPADERVVKPLTLRWQRYDSLALMVLTLLVFAIFGRTLLYGFTNWDDINFLLRNPVVRGLTWENVQRAFTPGGVPSELIYIPLTYLSHMVETELFGLRPEVIHTANVLLHTANVWLVFALVRRLSDNRRIAFVATLIFALHPLQVEPVAWAMGRKDLLAALAALLSMLAYHHFLLRGRRLWFAVSLACFVAAMLAKPTMIVLPVLLILMECYIKGAPPPQRWGSFLPFVLIALLGYWINSSMEVQPPDVLQPFWFRLLCLPWLGFHWVSHFFLLQRPLPFYVWPSADAWLLIAVEGALFLAVLAAVLWWAHRRRVHCVWFGLWFFAVGILPNVLLVWRPRDFITADRYGYFPLIGVAYILAVAWQRLEGRRRLWYRRALVIGGLAALISTWAQVSMWGSSLRLWSRVAAVYPSHMVVLNNLGMSWIDVGDTARAIEIFERALAEEEGYLTIRNNLVSALLQSGRTADAAAVAQRTVELHPLAASAWHRLGKARQRVGDPVGAAGAYHKAMSLEGSGEAYLELGVLLFEQGRLPEAERVLRAAIDAEKGTPEIAFNLGMICEQQGKPADAVRFYRLAASLDPSMVDAWYNLGNIYLHSQQPLEALANYQQALRLSPRQPDLLINAGQAAAQAKQPALAIDFYQRALEVGSEHTPMVHFLLGNTYAGLGQTGEARGAYQAALASQPDFPAAQQALDALPAP